MGEGIVPMPSRFWGEAGACCGGRVPCELLGDAKNSSEYSLKSAKHECA